MSQDTRQPSADPQNTQKNGGCSPVGMKKQYKTVFDESVLAQEKVYVSGGRIGTQVCCAPADLIRAARATTAKIIF